MPAGFFDAQQGSTNLDQSRALPFLWIRHADAGIANETSTAGNFPLLIPPKESVGFTRGCC
jgi:hypothetical protein